MMISQIRQSYCLGKRFHLHYVAAVVWCGLTSDPLFADVLPDTTLIPTVNTDLTHYIDSKLFKYHRKSPCHVYLSRASDSSLEGEYTAQLYSHRRKDRSL